MPNIKDHIRGPLLDTNINMTRAIKNLGAIMDLQTPSRSPQTTEVVASHTTNKEEQQCSHLNTTRMAVNTRNHINKMIIMMRLQPAVTIIMLHLLTVKRKLKVTTKRDHPLLTTVALNRRDTRQEAARKRLHMQMTLIMMGQKSTPDPAMIASIRILAMRMEDKEDLIIPMQTPLADNPNTSLRIMMRKDREL